jgi:C1A family cysteine protease
MPSARHDVPHVLPSGRRTGLLWEAADPRDLILDVKKAAKARGVSMPRGIPSKADLRLDGTLPSVKDQGNLGSCTGNGWAVGVEQFHNQVQSKYARTAVSRLQIYYDERAEEGSVSYDAGAWVRDGIKMIARNGVAPETLWPYNIARFTERPPQNVYDEAMKHQALTYAAVETNGVQWHLKQAIVAKTPVVFGFVVPAEYESVSSDGVMKTPGDRFAVLGGHCTVLVGYETLKLTKSHKVYGITQGSWGTSFGEAGFVYIELAWLTKRDYWIMDDAWAIQSMEI